MYETKTVVYVIVEREKIMDRRFEIMNANTRECSRYNSVERQLPLCLILPSNNTNPAASVNDLFELALRDVDDRDMVGITIQNQVNKNDKHIGISFTRRDQLSADVIWSFFESLSQSNSRFDALDTLVVTVHSVKMPVGLVNAQ